MPYMEQESVIKIGPWPRTLSYWDKQTDMAARNMGQRGTRPPTICHFYFGGRTIVADDALFVCWIYFQVRNMGFDCDSTMM